MGLVILLSFYIVTSIFTYFAEAALPWDSEISHPILKKADIVAFDPLSLLAILWNPRTSISAARLYMQSDRGTFRWPHMMQIGVVTVPVYMFVNHLTSNYRSIHTGLDMCQGGIDMLDVKSTISSVQLGSDSSFSNLPVTVGDSLIIKALNFRPSTAPTNDMMVIYLTELSKEGVIPLSKKAWIERKLVLCTEIVMGLIVVCGTVFGALLGDIWAIVLFATYFFHWLASTAVSFRQLVTPDRELKIQRDETVVFAVYTRPSGGVIIFKGAKGILERWARTKWVFRQNPLNTFLHWTWIITGTVAAFASQACMVNMGGYLQLGFLGMLLYSSVAELWLTVLANELPNDTFNRSLSIQRSEINDKRYKSIIQTSLGFDQNHRLEKLRWIDLGLLPEMTVFKAMVDTLDYLNNIHIPKSPTLPSNIDAAKTIFDRGCKTIPEKDFTTRDGIWLEIRRVWEQRQAEEPRILDVYHV